MKASTKKILTTLAKDRAIVFVMAGLIVTAVLCAIYFGVKINASDLQVSVKYTAFGTENVYRAHWTYFLSFVGFSIAIGVLHAGIMAKLYCVKGRRFALFFGWFSILLLILSAVLLYNIMTVAGRN